MLPLSRNNKFYAIFWTYSIIYFIALLLVSAGANDTNNGQNSTMELDESKNAETFGTRFFKAEKRRNLEERTPIKKRPRIRLSDVPYFDILSRNRDYRRKIINPSQLPRQPKERRMHPQFDSGNKTTSTIVSEEKYQLTNIKSLDRELKQNDNNNNKYFNDYTLDVTNNAQLIERPVRLNPSVPNITETKITNSTSSKSNKSSKKKAKQLYYYGPEFLKLLGISYNSDTVRNDGTARTTSLKEDRSSDENDLSDGDEKKSNNTSSTSTNSFLSSIANAAGSQIGVALASNVLGRPPISGALNENNQRPQVINKYHPQYLGGYPTFSGYDYDYGDDQDYDHNDDSNDDIEDEKEVDAGKTKKKKKKKRRPHKRPSRYGHPSYNPYVAPYSQYTPSYSTNPYLSGINQYQQQPLFGSRPGIGPGLAQSSYYLNGRPGIGSSISHGLSYPGGRPGIGSGITQGSAPLLNTHHLAYPSTYSGNGVNIPTSNYAPSGFASSYPSGLGYTNSIKTPYYSGLGYGRIALGDTLQARKKGVTVGKVVGGALAAGKKRRFLPREALNTLLYIYNI